MMYYRVAEYSEGCWGVQVRKPSAAKPFDGWFWLHSTFRGQYRARKLARWQAKMHGGVVVE